MRRIAIFILTIMLGLTACGKTNTENREQEDKETEKSEEITSVFEDKEIEEDNVEEVEWGVTDMFSANKDDKTTTIYINFPSLTGIPEATGLVAYQEDDTKVVLDAYIEGKSPEVDSVSEVFPAYFAQTLLIFKVNYGSRYSDGEFALEEQELLTVNDYEMCKYIGTHTFKYEGKEFSYRFVAYSTQLKMNGAYIYWLVQDESEDQTLFETIEDYAYKMGTTLWEE